MLKTPCDFLFVRVLFGVCCLGVWGLTTTASLAVEQKLTSPDGRIQLLVETTEEPAQSLRYSVLFDGEQVVAPSGITFRRQREVVGQALTGVEFGSVSAHRSQWEPVYGERSTVIDHYSELVVNARDAASGLGLSYTFRCYDAGVAFRTRIDAEKSLRLLSERSEFRFLTDAYAWRTFQAQGEYKKVKLSEMGSGVERPLVVQLGESVFVAVGEANLVDYARMRLATPKNDPRCVVSELSSEVTSDGPLTTPWRYVMLADTPGGLLEKNDLLLNLSEPCQLEDTSWIRPGKVLRDMTLTTSGGRAAVDFAAENNFQYILFDAGWYGHEYDEASDATTITVDPKRTPGPLDLLGVIDYAKGRGVGVILYVNRRALERQLDDILPLYKSWGVSGVKYGFVQVGSQKWTSWLHDAVRKAAKHKLVIDVHDEYRPTGYSRTYPNLLTQEGVRGDEASPTSEIALTTVFTRGIAGANDHTVCYFAPRVQELWTNAHQLAKTVCMYSPLQFLYWYDTPLQGVQDRVQRNLIVDTPEQQFFRDVPTVWDDTRVLSGSIGEHAVIARRSGDDWFVGAMNNQTPRTLKVGLGFLEAGREYQATIYTDDETVATPTKVSVEQRSVASEEVLTLELIANGGYAMRISPR